MSATPSCLVAFSSTGQSRQIATRAWIPEGPSRSQTVACVSLPILTTPRARFSLRLLRQTRSALPPNSGSRAYLSSVPLATWHPTGFASSASLAENRGAQTTRPKCARNARPLSRESPHRGITAVGVVRFFVRLAHPRSRRCEIFATILPW